MAAFDFPNSPSNGDTYSANGIDWIYNGSVWKKDATAGVKGQKGEVGQKGQKGEVGEKGTKGEVGDKGQKGEIGATGGTGGTGTKGQKGEVGATGAAASKGQKGEVGSQGGTGGTGNAGADGDKGQKGEVGSVTAAIPSGGIIIWSGASNAIPSGWYLCNGSNGTPDLRNRFIVGAGSGYSVGNTGGADSVTLTTTQIPSHDHNVDVLAEFASTHGTWQVGGGYRQVHTGGTHRKPITSDTGGGGSHENRPPYYALCYIMKS